DSADAIKAEALRILKLLEEMPFDDCCPLTKEFAELPARPGIYAVKHKQQGLLYVGKSGSVKGRFKGGHKALGWTFMDRLDPDDVRIAVVTLKLQWIRLSLQLEQIITRELLPPYNVRV
ncbi:MAG: GIY-YIG nuclease family protein, partial [Cyanobacteria bacterium J06626_14]